MAAAEQEDPDHAALCKVLEDMTTGKGGIVSNFDEVRHVLQYLIRRTADQGFREEVAWADAVPSLLAVVHTFFSLGDTGCEGRVNVRDDRGLPVMLLITKLLRNLCAGVPANRNAFRVWDGVGTMAEIAGRLIAARELGFAGDTVVELLPVILQVLGNFANSGQENQEVVWKIVFPGVLLVFSQLEDAKVYDPLCMLLFTCCRGSPQRIAELCSLGSPLLGALLSFAAKHLGYGGLNISSSSVLQTVGPANVEASKRNVHVWLELLLTQICLEQPFLASAFIGLGTAPTGPERKQSGRASSSEHQPYGHSSIGRLSIEIEAFSNAQVFLLGTLCSILHDRVEDRANSGTEVLEKSGKSSVISRFPSDSASFLVSLIKFAALGKHFDVDDSTLASDILRLGLSLIRIVCLLESEDYGEGEELSATIMQLLSGGLLGLMLEMLDALGPPEAVQALSRSAEPAVHRGSPSGFVSRNPYAGYRRDIVGVLSNISYRNRLVQDETRKCGGLLLVLQQCVVDKYNPFLREWGYWAMRNFLAGNEENQKIIEELEVKGAVNTEEVHSMGFSVEIDTITRRPKLVNRTSSVPDGSLQMEQGD